MAYKIAHECNMFGPGKSIFIHSVEHGLHRTYFQVTFGSSLVRESNTTCSSFLEIGAVVARAHQTHMGFLSPAWRRPRKCLCLLVVQCLKFHNSEQPSGKQIPFQTAPLGKQKCFPTTPVKKNGAFLGGCAFCTTQVPSLNF